MFFGVRWVFNVLTLQSFTYAVRSKIFTSTNHSFTCTNPESSAVIIFQFFFLHSTMYAVFRCVRYVAKNLPSKKKKNNNNNNHNTNSNNNTYVSDFMRSPKRGQFHWCFWHFHRYFWHCKIRSTPSLNLFRLLVLLFYCLYDTLCYSSHLNSFQMFRRPFFVAFFTCWVLWLCNIRCPLSSML